MDGRRLKEWRKRHNMSQKQLAKELGVTQPLVSLMESDKASVTYRTRKQLQVIAREAVRRSHYLNASRITGRTVEELGGADDELEEL